MQMPTYRNDTNQPIISLGIRFEPGQIIKSIKILEDGLTMISDQPYYNPLSDWTEVLTSTGIGDDKEVNVDHILTKTISIFNSSDQVVDVFINQTENDKALKSYPNTERILAVNQAVEKLIFQFPAAATIYVEQRR
jgi:hypothetical protein